MTTKTQTRSPTLLSICIPTYNFGAFIGETLESILPQVVDGVEVVILDGGSTDNTPDVVRAFQDRYRELRYERRSARGGIDRDIARTVDLARGRYCWLFCSDDVMKPGAIDCMLDRIRSELDIYVCGFTLCTRDMRPIRDEPIAAISCDSEFDLGQEHDRREYFERALRTPAFFSFAGSLIIKKTRWDSCELDEDFVGSCWAHVARIFGMIPEGLRLGYLATSYLYKRTENDSFMDNGIVRRYALAIDGYHRLADTFFEADSSEAHNVRRAVKNEFPPLVLLAAKAQASAHRREDLPLLDRLAAKAYADRSLGNRMGYLTYRLTPVPAYLWAWATYRRLRLVSRSRAVVRLARALGFGREGSRRAARRHAARPPGRPSAASDSRHRSAALRSLRSGPRCGSGRTQAIGLAGPDAKRGRTVRASLRARLLSRVAAFVAPSGERPCSPSGEQGREGPFAQFGEDRMLDEIFAAKDRGHCVEVGAYDGLTGSMTLHFERKGWRCLLVEPVPELAEQARRHRSGVVRSCAVSSREGEATLSVAKGVEQMSTLRLTPGHRRWIEDVGGSVKQVAVPTTTLDRLLADAAFPQIDFITIDVEGHELDALQGLSLERIRPRIVIIEDNSAGSDSAVRRHLADRGYINFRRTGVNDWYAHEQDSELTGPRSLDAFAREQRRRRVRRRLLSSPAQLLPDRVRRRLSDFVRDA